MTDVIRKQILIELINILENPRKKTQLNEFDIPYSLGDIEAGKAAIESLVSRLRAAWENFKKFGTNVKQLMDMASGLSFDDIKVLLQKDPVSLVCLALDTISLFDPTGVADLTQGFILLAQGIAEGSAEGIIFGIICVAMGLGQAALLAGSGGTSTPLVLALKQGLKVSLKNLSLEAFEKMIKSLLSVSSKILDFLKESIVGKKFYNVVASFFNKVKNFKASSFKSIDEAVEYLTGFSIKNSFSIVTPEVKKKIVEGALLVGQLKFYQAGAGGARLTAIQLSERLPRIRELYMRNVVCKLNRSNSDLCSKVITNTTDLSVSGFEESDVETYENIRKNLNPLKIIKWYDEEGSKMPL